MSILPVPTLPPPEIAKNCQKTAKNCQKSAKNCQKGGKKCQKVPKSAKKSQNMTWPGFRDFKTGHRMSPDVIFMEGLPGSQKTDSGRPLKHRPKSGSAGGEDFGGSSGPDFGGASAPAGWVALPLWIHLGFRWGFPAGG